MPRTPRRITVKPLPGETEEERWLLQEQTNRNLRGLEHEQAGELDEAVGLYELNLAEGFAGDWPYGRLVAIYEKRAALNEAARVLERAIEVITASSFRTAEARRGMVSVFKRRLALVKKKLKAEERDAIRAARAAAPKAPRKSKV